MSNNSSVKNINIKKNVIAMALAGALTTTALTGCGNYTMVDTKYTYNKALIFRDNSVTIVEVESWADYDGEQIQIKTPEGLYFVTSSFDTKLIDDSNSNISAEDFARSIVGEDVTINYLNNTKQKTK